MDPQEEGDWAHIMGVEGGVRSLRLRQQAALQFSGTTINSDSPDSNLFQNDMDGSVSTPAGPRLCSYIPVKSAQKAKGPKSTSTSQRSHRLRSQEAVSTQASNKMPSHGSTAGSTQPFSQAFFDDYMSTSKLGISNSRSNRSAPPATVGTGTGTGTITTDTGIGYQSGDVGYVRLDLPELREKQTAANVEAESEEGEDGIDDLTEDVGTVTQQNMQASQFPEDKRFQAPKTPAFRGKKRRHTGKVVSEPGSTSDTTPQLLVNPFGAAPAHTGIMSLSQVFKATQAPSSPLLNVPTSDGLADRPSPNMWNIQRPSTAPESSPAKWQTRRSEAEPYTTYIPMRQSQEEREQRTLAPLPSSEPAHAKGDISSDDGLFDGETQMELDLKYERIRRQVDRRKAFERITATIVSPINRGEGCGEARGRGRGRRVQMDCATSLRPQSSPVTSRTTSELLPLVGMQNSPIAIDDDAHKINQILDDGLDAEEKSEQSMRSPVFTGFEQLDDEETEHECAQLGGDSEADDSDTGNKENLGHARSVQVPRTISKQRRHILVKQDFHQMNALASTEEEIEPGIVAVANSQPVNGMVTQARASCSSFSNGLLAPQSQVPDSSHFPDLSDATKGLTRVAPSRSQQTATPPSSSPSPQKQTPERALDEAVASVRRRRRMNAITIPAMIHQEQSSDDELANSKQMSYQFLRAQPASVVTDQTLEKDDDELSEPANPEVESSLALPTTIQETRFDNNDGRLFNITTDTVSPFTAFPTAPNKVNPSEIPSPRKPQLRRPRKFTEIIPQQSASSQGLDLDFTALTREDQDFQARLGVSQGSSPIPSAHRRVRLFGDRTSLPNPPIEISSSAAKSTNGETGEYHTAPSPSPTPTGRQRASSVTSLELALNTSEKENEPSHRSKRPIIHSTPDLEHVPKPMQSKKLLNSRVINSPEKTYSRKRARTTASPTRSHRASNPAMNDIDQTLVVLPAQIDLSEVFAPTRVWAFFNGSPAGYYPAICSGPAGNNRLNIEFDDATKVAIPSASVRRLELRVGDTIKIDRIENRSSIYVIQELLEKQISYAAAAHQRGACDVHGWTKMRVALKNKDGTLQPRAEPVPLDFTYLTQTLFNNLKDREYIHPQPVHDLHRPVTPSLCGSGTISPSSRQRRAKVTTKKECSIVRKSPNPTTNRKGVFSGMAFVVTAVEKLKRLDLESAIIENGGRLIVDGLDSLFTMPTKSQTQSSAGASNTTFGLNGHALNFTFTALLTDKHCRTTAYLHALALNIPCLSLAWVRDCIAKKQVTDWRTYLLPSGDSQVLDGATRSRVLEIPAKYSSTNMVRTWPLTSMFESRPKIMHGQNVLIVASGTAAAQKPMNAYIFIAYALGAVHVALAQGWKEARDYAKDGRRSWDWICAADDANGHGGRRAKKRKSGAMDGADDLEVKRKDGTRVVKPEFVVQSLVLGRLVRE